MTEKEQSLKEAELAYKTQMTVVRDAKADLEEGYKRMKAKLDLNYQVLKSEHERQMIELERCSLEIEKCKDKIAKNFD